MNTAADFARTNFVEFKFGEETIKLPSLFLACLDHGNRVNQYFDLSVPFRYGDFLWATNREIIARIRLRLLASYAVDKLPAGNPWGRSLRHKASIQDIWDANLPADVKFETLVLPMLEEGQQLTECDDCNKGKVFCQFGHEHECPDCKGSGKVPNFSGVKLGPLSLAEHYIHLLRSEGIDTVSRVIRPAKPTKDEIPFVCFTQGIVEGLLAGVTAPPDGCEYP